ncbi:MAG: DUF3179 domain-containing protein [Pseudomonadota bacterium]
MRWLVPLVAVLVLASPAWAADLEPEAYAELAAELVFGTPAAANETLRLLVARGDADAAATLIMAMRFGRPVDDAALDSALEDLTGAGVDGWFDWMLWQQRSDQRPHAGHALFQDHVWQAIDPRFAEFFPPDAEALIRREEIVWGGVRVDGIPALTNPTLIAARDAGYLTDADLVFGVSIAGDARAYPLRIVNWHEMVNDVVGGRPVSLAYCTLCGAGIVFATDVPGREPLVFGSSGLLYRSNKLMYDTATKSLWNQFTGRPVLGDLVGSDLELEILPVTLTTWGEWRQLEPTTRVLDDDTGFVRDYGPGAAYGAYFASPELMFPALLDDARLSVKDQIFGVRAPGGAKAWALELFEGGAVVNDTVGLWEVALVGDAATRTVRAYRREPGETFEAMDGELRRNDDVVFALTETQLVGTNGATRARVPGHVAYWFAWAGYLGAGTDLRSGAD